MDCGFQNRDRWFDLINKGPYSFWIAVPLGGLLLRLLVWRSRSIDTSMVAHGITNGLGQLITFYKF